MVRVAAEDGLFGYWYAERRDHGFIPGNECIVPFVQPRRVLIKRGPGARVRDCQIRFVEIETRSARSSSVQNCVCRRWYIEEVSPSGSVEAGSNSDFLVL